MLIYTKNTWRDATLKSSTKRNIRSYGRQCSRAGSDPISPHFCFTRRRIDYRHLSRGVAEILRTLLVPELSIPIGQISATRTTDLPYTRITADQLPLLLSMVPVRSTIIPLKRVSQPGRRCTFYYLIEEQPLSILSPSRRLEPNCRTAFA